MHTKVLFIVLFLLNYAYGQDSDYITYEIDGVCVIKIPSSLELKNKEQSILIYEKPNSYRLTGINPKVIFQQNKMKENTNTFVRVIIETIISSPRFYDVIQTDIPYVNQAEINELNKQLKMSAEYEYKKINCDITNWYGTSYVKVNNQVALKYSFKRICNQFYQEETIVVAYTFENNDRVHKVTLSYWIKDSDIWKDQLESILKDLIITTKN